MNEQTTQPQPDNPRRLYRARDDRVIAGVCAGIARYFNIDPVIVRVAAVVLVFFGGAGALAYVAALLLVPDEEGGTVANSKDLRGRALTVVAVVLLVVAAGAFLPWGWDWFLGGLLLPVAILAFGAYAVWTLVSGDRERKRPEGAALARRVLLVCALLAGCTVLAAGAGWAAAVGGGEVVAILVIAAGVMLAVGAFLRPVRWLVAPALALALPLALVSAAGIEVDNSIGEREYEPGSAAEIRDRYELGMGDLVVDLRDAGLTAGDQTIDLEVGIGRALLVVPEDVCVASEATVGAGAVDVFDQTNAGIDIDWEETQDTRAEVPRVLLDAEVGLGAVQVTHDPTLVDADDWDEKGVGEGNDACDGEVARG
jgi:phage shock protein PspC (stress-responsive transcriptional regulator)